jgi:hypothetical protein
MKYLQTALAVVLYIGTVDSVDNGVAQVEVSASDNKIHQLNIPVLLIPCDVEEQDVFYFLYSDGVVEIRCGEPPA